MKKNLGPDTEDRGVEGGTEELLVDGKKIIHKTPPALDALGEPAAPEDNMGGD